jgi:dipeptidyl aminopeptidase/acylaminoacyl peptidase
MIGANGGKPVRLTTHPANDGDPSWSRDGKWICFDSARTGEQQVWKIPADGGEAIQVTWDGGFAPLDYLNLAIRRGQGAPQTTNAVGADFRGADLDSCLMYRAETQSTRFDDASLSEKSDMPGRRFFGTARVLA